MRLQSGILQANSQLSVLDDVYQDVNVIHRESKLSKAVLTATTDLFQHTQDRALFSIDFETRIDVDELTPELASARFNFLQVLQLENVGNALEMSEDFGGVAHYLSDRVKNLDSVKIDSNRARMATIRCANKNNIWHISEDCDKLNLPTQHYDLIVLAAYETLNISQESRQEFFSKLQNSLTPTGALILNVKNLNRISNWLNPQDNSSPGAVPFKDLYHTDQENEFDRKGLLDTLALANFNAIEFNASFSRGNDYQNMFSEDYLTSNLNAPNHFYRLGMIDNNEVNEYLLFKNLFAAKKRVFDLASRYLIVAGSSSRHTRNILDQDFAHFAGTGRMPKWRTTTQRHRAAANIQKKPTYLQPEVSTIQSTKDDFVTQNLAPHPFVVGRLLIDDWLAATEHGQSDALSELVNEYSNWLTGQQEKADFCEFAYDLLPFNILVKEHKGKRDYHMFDTEWQIDESFDAEFILFRALFYFAFENKAALRAYAYSTDISCIGIFCFAALTWKKAIVRLTGIHRLGGTCTGTDQ